METIVNCFWLFGDQSAIFVHVIRFDESEADISNESGVSIGGGTPKNSVNLMNI